MIGSCKVNVPFKRDWVLSCVSNTSISSFVKQMKQNQNTQKITTTTKINLWALTKEIFFSVPVAKSIFLISSLQEKNGFAKMLLMFGCLKTCLCIKNGQNLKWNLILNTLFYEWNIFLIFFFSTWKKSLNVFSWADTFSFILANSLLQIFVRGTDKLSILKSQSKVDIKVINTGLSFCALYVQVPKQNYFIGTSWGQPVLFHANKYFLIPTECKVGGWFSDLCCYTK